MLYDIEGTPHRILGSFHALPENYQRLPIPWAAALAESHQLVVEARIDRPFEITGEEFTDETGLRDVLGQERYNKVEEIWRYFDRNVEALNRVKPWWVLSVLHQHFGPRVGLHSQYGIDLRMISDVLREGRKPIIRLETVDTGLDCSRLLPLDEQAQLLDYFCDDLTRARNELVALFEAWARGDVLKLTEIVEAKRKLFPGFYERVLDRRNDAWMPTIMGIIKGDQPALIVIGALHCIGVGSVNHQLANHGLNVELTAPYLKQKPQQSQ